MIVRNLVILVNLVENVQVWRPSEPERDLTRLESKHEIFFLCVYKYWSQIHHGDNVNSQSRSGAGTLEILIHNKLIFDWKIDLIGIYFAIQLKTCVFRKYVLFSFHIDPWPSCQLTIGSGDTGDIGDWTLTTLALVNTRHWSQQTDQTSSMTTIHVI